MVDWEFKKNGGNPELVGLKSAEAIVNAKQYERLVKWTIGWRVQALLLFTASEHILAISNAASARMEALISSEFSNESSSSDLEGSESQDLIDSQLLPIALLLKGYAIENLIKGIIYSQHPGRCKENDKGLWLDGKLTNHCLGELYVAAGLAKNKDAIDSEIKEILEVLEKVILWQGRYPVPLNLERYKQKIQFTDRLRNPKEINDLFLKLLTYLKTIPNPNTH